VSACCTTALSAAVTTCSLTTYTAELMPTLVTTQATTKYNKQTNKQTNDMNPTTAGFYGT